MSDLIYRHVAIDALDEQIKHCDKALASFDISMRDEYAVKVERASLNAYRETIEQLPSAQPEPKTGHWIAYEVQLLDRVILNYHCSVCGRKLVGYSTETLKDAPYCHCGAKMEVEHETD